MFQLKAININSYMLEETGTVIFFAIDKKNIHIVKEKITICSAGNGRGW